MLMNMWEKGTPMHCWGECKLMQPLQKTMGSPQEIKSRTTILFSNPTSGLCLKETESPSSRAICTLVFTVALLTIAVL